MSDDTMSDDTMSEQPLTLTQLNAALDEKLKPIKDELATIAKEFKRGGLVYDGFAALNSTKRLEPRVKTLEEKMFSLAKDSNVTNPNKYRIPAIS